MAVPSSTSEPSTHRQHTTHSTHKHAHGTMNRTDGLVRRVRTRDPAADGANGGANGPNGSAANGDDNNDNVRADEEQQELEDNDSKETRLTLMEEVLLLGLKDKEVFGCRCDVHWRSERCADDCDVCVRGIEATLCFGFVRELCACVCV